MGRYDRQIASAQRLIKKYGKLTTWRSHVEGVTTEAEAPGATPWRPKAGLSNGSPSYQVTVVFFPIGKEKRESLSEMGIELTSGAQIGYMPAVPFVPAQKDTILRNGVYMPVEHIEVLAPNDDEPILYEFVVQGPVLAGQSNG